SDEESNTELEEEEVDTGTDEDDSNRFLGDDERETFKLAAGDSTPPVVESVEISPREANTGDTIKIKAKITDDISGVKSNLVVFESPSGNSERSFALKENKDTGYWEYNYTVGEHDEAGDWQLRSFLVRDNANNYKIYYSNEIEGSLDFRVNNTSGDNTPPEIKSVEISPKEANAGETIKIKTKITDDISGVKSNLVVFESPSRNSERSFALKENKNTGYWEYNYTVGEYDEVGDWQLRSFLVRDNANNYKI